MGVMSARNLIVSVIVFAFVLAARPASADDPNRVFAGQIIPMVKRPPSTAKSPAAYVQLMRKMKQLNFAEDKSTHTWTLWLACFLKVPLNDVEYSIKYYELNGRTQQFLASSDNFTDTRGEKTILTKVTIDKKWSGVNKNLLVTLENKGKILASTTIKILGEGERFSGKVDFTEQEAAGKDGDDDAKKDK
jgi:hypothetical protein